MKDGGERHGQIASFELCSNEGGERGKLDFDQTLGAVINCSVLDSQYVYNVKQSRYSNRDQ